MDNKIMALVGTVGILMCGGVAIQVLTAEQASGNAIAIAFLLTFGLAATVLYVAFRPE